MEASLGYEFEDLSLLAQALTHASRSAQSGGRESDNERLEFLGDRVLGLVVAELLLEQFPGAREGELAPRLNVLVRKETLADIATALGLPPLLRLAKGEAKGALHLQPNVLADACEAVIAALYLDGGLVPARAFVRRVLAPRLAELTHVPRDPKTTLQEWAQGKGIAAPRYVITGREGPDHEPRFAVAVEVEGFAPVGGEGPSKRAAEQAAAGEFLRREQAS